MTLLAGEQILLNAGELMLTTHRIRFDSRTRPTITSLLLEELSVCSFRARRFRGGKGLRFFFDICAPAPTRSFFVYFWLFRPFFHNPLSIRQLEAGL